MKGVFIALFGPSRSGKTSTITRVAQKLGTNQAFGQDFSAVCIHPIYDLKIGLASMGDPFSAQKESLINLIKQNCSIIVCASRTKGSTVNDIIELANQYNYTIIWGTPFYEPSASFNPRIMHESNAEAVIALIERIAISM